MLKSLNLFRKTKCTSYKPILHTQLFLMNAQHLSACSNLMTQIFNFSTKKPQNNESKQLPMKSRLQRILRTQRKTKLIFGKQAQPEASRQPDKKDSPKQQYILKNITKSTIPPKTIPRSLQVQDKSFTKSIGENSKKNQNLETGEKTSKRKKINKKSTNSQMTKEQSTENQRTEVQNKKIKSFYKILNQDSQINQSEALIGFLESSHNENTQKIRQRNLFESHQGKRKQRKPKRHQQIDQETKPLFSKKNLSVSFQKIQNHKKFRKPKKETGLSKGTEQFEGFQQVQAFEDLKGSNDPQNDSMLENQFKMFEESDHKQMKTLNSILKQASQQMQFPDQSHFEQNFFYVLNPENQKEALVSFGFRYFLFKLCKYNVYFSQVLTPEELACLNLKAKNTVIHYCLQEEGKGKEGGVKLPDEKIKYIEYFLINLLGPEVSFFYEPFILAAFNYFTQLKLKLNLNQSKTASKQKPYIPSKNVLLMILNNLERILSDSDEDQNFDITSPKQQDYALHREIFDLYLDFYCMRKNEFDTVDKIKCVGIAKFLKIQHPEFIQFIKETLQTDQQNYSTAEFLIMLGYLVETKNTPYEYFYQHKGSWMKIIHSAHDFSSKKTKCCINFLEIFSRERFVHCQQIYFELLQSIENNLEAMEGKQLVRVLYFYSKAKYGTNARFLSNLVGKISRWLPMLEEVNFSLLVRSIGNLNYQSEELVEKLKNINYERFLYELKFGCENLGEYYQEILREVEEQSRGRDSFDGDQIFIGDEGNLQESVPTQKVF